MDPLRYSHATICVEAYQGYNQPIPEGHLPVNQLIQTMPRITSFPCGITNA
jgi:hypothetical protein